MWLLFEVVYVAESFGCVDNYHCLSYHCLICTLSKSHLLVLIPIEITLKHISLVFVVCWRKGAELSYST
jgi:hypothetical protein